MALGLALSALAPCVHAQAAAGGAGDLGCAAPSSWAPVRSDCGWPAVALCESPFLGVSGFAKRMEDLVLGLLILLLIAPLLLLVAIGVKLSSPGPVLFCQRRYGLDGK